MQIERAELRHLRIGFKRAFAHALHERAAADLLLVELHDDEGNVGLGEIVPRPYVTGESIDTVLDERGPELAARLASRRFASFDDAVDCLRDLRPLVGRDLASLCGFDLALLDLAGQRFGVPVAEALGGMKFDPLPAGVIVGFEISTEKLARYCATLRLAGKRHVKIKVGLDDDAERIAAAVKVFKDTPLRLDANAAWSASETIERLRVFTELAPIHSIEQPIPAEDIPGLARIRRETGVPVMADESVCTLEDAHRLIEAEAVDIFNVRLGKNGGMLASAALVELAHRSGIRVHLGTMVGETGILGAASEIFGRSLPGFDCLDGKGQNAFLLEVDIARQSSQHGDPSGSTAEPGLPGLGVQLRPEGVQSLQVGESRTIERP